MQNKINLRHFPVLLKEVIDGLDVKVGKRYIDATLGDAGHALEIVRKGGLLLGIDRDPEAVKRARVRLKQACPASYQKIGGKKISKDKLQPIIRQGNFNSLKSIAIKNGFKTVKGVLFDLGISSCQLESRKRGLSFLMDSPLDMRLDPSVKKSAKNLVNKLSEKELYGIFTRNAQEELARPIAKAIISSRDLKPITKTRELVNIILKVKPRTRSDKLHPATKVFLALRIEVNNEIENLKQGIEQALEILNIGGKLAVISFHETEDRIVKQVFKREKRKGRALVLAKKPITPSDNELRYNPRSRSAKLRVLEKI